MAGNFEKTNLDWQIQLVLRQIGEAVEKLFQAAGGVTPPNFSPPEAFFRGVFWLLVLVLVAWLLWQLYGLLSPYWGLPLLRRRRASSAPMSQPEPVLSLDAWLERSRSLAQQGNYREACRALYQAMLHKLDGTGLVPALASRTDGEYLNCLQTLPNPRPYQVVIQVHERLCFSDAPITPELFRRCEQAYQETNPS